MDEEAEEAFVAALKEVIKYEGRLGFNISKINDRIIYTSVGGKYFRPGWIRGSRRGLNGTS
jgi:hypothetical protein